MTAPGGKPEAAQAPELAHTLRRESEPPRTLAPEPELAATLARTGSAPAPLGGEEQAVVTPEAGGRYEVRGELGRGGIGRVLLALDEHVGREVAIKELLDAPGGGTPASTSQSASVRFLREARLTAQLEHPSIVPVYEVGRRTDGTLYYTMRMVRGRTLATALRSCPSVGERLRLLPHFADLCAAVAFAHSRGVLHRDLKPHNVMIGEFNETVLLDWGLAKLKGSEREDRRFARQMEALRDVAAGKTIQGEALGTPEYMPPEQAFGDLEHVDERSDVYSLGAVLYELLTGHPPFSGLHALEILTKVQRYGEGKQGLVPVRQSEPQAPAELAAVAHKALRPATGDRYGGAKQLLEEINAFMAGRRVGAYEYGSLELLRRFVAKNRAVSLLAGALLATLVAGSGALLRAWRESKAAELRVHHDLAAAYQDKAAQLAAGRDLLGARVFAAAALRESPFNPRGRYPDAASLGTAQGDEALASLQSTLWSAAQQGMARHVGSLDGHQASVEIARFSPDGALLATAGADRTVRVWSVAERRQLHERTSAAAIAALAWSPDGKLLAYASAASGNLGKDIALWELGASAEPAALRGHSDSITALSFSPDGALLASAGRDRSVRLWQLSSRAEVGQLAPPAQEGFPERIAFSPSGAHLGVTGYERELLIYDVATRAVAHRLRVGDGSFVGLLWCRDGRHVWGLGSDRTVREYDAGTGEELTALTLGGAQPKGLSARFDETGDETLLAVGHYETIELWDPASGERAEVLHGHGGQVRGVTFSPDGKLLASFGLDHRVLLWEIAPKAPLKRLFAHDALITALAVSADGTRLASANRDRVAQLWQTGSPRALVTWDAHASDVSAALFARDGTLLTAGRDGTIKLWDAEATTPLATLSDPQARQVWALSLSPDGKLLASADGDGKVRLWDLGKRELARVLAGHAELASAVAFAPDGATLASGGRDKIVRLWDAATGQERSAWTLPDRVRALAFSPDGALLAVADSSWAVSLLDARSGEVRRTLKGHHDAPRALAFSGDGKLLLSAGGADMTVRLWEIPSGRLLQVFDLPDEARAVALMPGGRTLLASSGAQLILAPIAPDLWRGDPEQMLKEAERDAAQSLRGFALEPLSASPR